VANKEHIERLKRGVAEWNAWREEAASREPDLSGANLFGADFHGANFHGAILAAHT